MTQFSALLELYAIFVMKNFLRFECTSCGVILHTLIVFRFGGLVMGFSHLREDFQLFAVKTPACRQCLRHSQAQTSD